MVQGEMPASPAQTGLLRLCWGLFGLWVPLSLLSSLIGNAGWGPALTGLQALLLAIFVVFHGALAEGWRGIASFAGIVAITAFLLEASSIATGFPFGYYEHAARSSPMPLGVPVEVILGYVVLGWLAWNIARLIVRDDPSRPYGASRFTTPLIAAFVLAGYDFPYDPIGSTVLHMWTYRHPSGTFGVPMTNYLGWLFTGWACFQLYALVEIRLPARRLPPSVWAMPALVWLVFAAQYPFMLAGADDGMASQGNRTFVIADIYEAAFSASLFTIVFVSLIALSRLPACARQSYD